MPFVFMRFFRHFIPVSLFYARRLLPLSRCFRWFSRFMRMRRLQLPAFAHDARYIDKILPRARYFRAMLRLYQRFLRLMPSIDVDAFFYLRDYDDAVVRGLSFAQ